MDLDHFKNINDQYGHQAGDNALMVFTQVCREVIREQDVLGRLGGEEFGLMLPETGLQQAYIVAERIRIATYECNFAVDGKRVPMSVSIGLVEISHDDEMLGSVVRRADMAMYRAKEAGRNQVKTA